MNHHPRSSSILCGALILSATLACHTRVRAEPVQARSAADFLDSMGVCVQIYDNEIHDSIIKPRLEELGIRHLRVELKKPGDNNRGKGEVQFDRLKQMGEQGYKITALWHCWYTMDEFLKLTESLLPNSIYQAEGPNEPWNGHQNFKWEGEKWPKGASLFMEDMHTALRSRASTKHIPILSFSGTTAAYGSIEPWIDFGNEHLYTDNGESLTGKKQLEKLIERCRSTQYPAKPLQFTEAGYNSDPKSFRGTSPGTQARGVPRIYLETFRLGIVRTFIYGLLMKDDAGFSLLETDGAPKPAFAAIKAMRTILKDKVTKDFKPGTLDLIIDAKVPSVHHLLLQKSTGSYFLCLWNDVDGWDEKTKRDIENPEQPVSLTFAKAPSSISAHLPMSQSPAAMKTSIQTGKTLTVKIPDHPLILEIIP